MRLDAALHQTVRRLNLFESLQPLPVADLQALLNLNGAEVTAPGRSNLTLFNSSRQSFHPFFEWRLGVERMKEIQINPIGLQPVQAGIDSILNMLPREVCRDLSLQNNARSVAAGLQPSSNNFFRRMHLGTCFADVIDTQSVAAILAGLASTVSLCRVEQGHIEVESGAHQPG